MLKEILFFKCNFWNIRNSKAKWLTPGPLQVFVQIPTRNIKFNFWLLVELEKSLREAQLKAQGYGCIFSFSISSTNSSLGSFPLSFRNSGVHLELQENLGGFISKKQHLQTTVFYGTCSTFGSLQALKWRWRCWTWWFESDKPIKPLQECGWAAPRQRDLPGSLRAHLKSSFSASNDKFCLHWQVLSQKLSLDKITRFWTVSTACSPHLITFLRALTRTLDFSCSSLKL